MLKIVVAGGNEKLMEDNESARKLNASKSQEFSGRVENISISSSGSHFQFDVVSKKDGRRTYMLNSNSPTDYLAMASFISSTCAAGKKSDGKQCSKWHWLALCQRNTHWKKDQSCQEKC